MEFQRDYTSQLETYMGSDEVKATGELSYVNAYFATNQADAVGDMWAFAGNLAKKDPNGPLVKPADVAQSLNEHLKRAFGPMVQALTSGSPTEVTPPSAPQETPADNRTLTNASSAASQQNRPKGGSQQERYANAVAWANANLTDK